MALRAGQPLQALLRIGLGLLARLVAALVLNLSEARRDREAGAVTMGA